MVTSEAVPVLHIVCGKIGAGKSTLTKRLAAAPATVLISEDDWLAALYPDEIHTLADYVRCSGRLRQIMAVHVEALLVSGMSVVLDFPANTLNSRAWARGIFEKAGVAHRLHFLDVPDAVC
jgi:predicted kinase